MNQELVRIIDGIAREKNIETEAVFTDLEAAMISAVRKQYDQADEVQVSIDRLSGVIQASRNSEPISVAELGRIAAQTAKQVMIQRLREDERGSILEEYEGRKGTIVTGTVSRFESGSMVVNLGRTEGFLPRSEQIPGETHHPGERIRALILEVREVPHQVKIILSRTHPDFIRCLFELEVPEVSERIIELKAMAREPGYRTKIAVSSIDLKVDPVGACVGVRGSRIKNIVDELGGEKIDIVRWNESSQVLIRNALRPAEVVDIALCFELGRATVVVNEDQLSLAIGKRGQNVRLAARLTGWDTEILTPKEYNAGLEALIATLRELDYMDDTKVDRVIAMGMINLLDIEEVGHEPFVQELELSEEQATDMVTKASAAAKLFVAEQEKIKAAEAEAAKEKAAADKIAADKEKAEIAAAKKALAGPSADEESDQEPKEKVTGDDEQDQQDEPEADQASEDQEEDSTAEAAQTE
jgi:N utilization substance protein A